MHQRDQSELAPRLVRYVFEQRYWLASGLLLLAMASHSVYGDWAGDFWEHSAVVRELATNTLSPLHPILDVPESHPFFSPYSLLLACIARLTSFSVVTVMALAGIVNLGLLLAGLRYFVQVMFERDQHVISFYVLLLMLFAWPLGTWNWSGFYHFRAMGYVLPYPSTFAFGLTLIVLADYARHLRGGRWNLFRVGCQSAAIGVVLITHPMTAGVTFIGVFALSVSEAQQSRMRSLPAGGGVMALAIVLAFIWPYYSFLALISHNNPEFHEHSYVLYQNLRVLWPLLLLLPLATYGFVKRLGRNRLDALAVMLLAAVAVYAVGYLSGQYGLGRVVSFIALLIQIVAVAAIAPWETRQPLSRAWLVPFLIALFLVPLAANYRNKETAINVWRGAQGVRVDYNEYEAIGDTVGQYDIVLTDLETALMVPAFAGKVVASPHPVHWVADHAQRRKDVQRFFEITTSDAERRSLIAKYEVDYVLVDTRSVSDPTMFLTLGTVVEVTDHFRLIAVGGVTGQDA